MGHDPQAVSKAKAARLADLDAIEAALEAGEPVEPHLKHYKKLAKYIAGFRQRNQDLIDEVAELRNENTYLSRVVK